MNKGSESPAMEVHPNEEADISNLLDIPLKEARSQLSSLDPAGRLAWAKEQFKEKFVLTTSFGIQSAVLLHMVHRLKETNQIPIIWIDTGYLPPETYCYAEELINHLNIEIQVIQSPISPARMEALYGKLWETNSLKDIEKYHLIRKVKPLEQALNDLQVQCWASGVRGNQTDHRSSMTLLDEIRGRLSLRPLLEWKQKDIFYYMKENQLPQHPLFEKGYSSVGDWHSSGPEGSDVKGRNTRFGGLKQECGIHVQGVMGDGI
tara:strand:- start:982 stop:1767 length:786 start_codon:yes stop_codon:yes gene_type:complete